MKVLHWMGTFWMAVLIVSAGALLTYKLVEHVAGMVSAHDHAVVVVSGP